MARPTRMDYDSDQGGHKHAHTPKFPKDRTGYEKMRGAAAPDDLCGPIIHDDRNPATEEPFTPIFSWILTEAKYLLDIIEKAPQCTPPSSTTADYPTAVKDFENFVGYLNNRDTDPNYKPPTPPSGRKWAKLWPTISQADIEPVFSKGVLSGIIVTVTWLGGTHTSSSSESYP